MEKMLKDQSVSDADKSPVQGAVDKLKQAASKDDVNAINTAISELEQASMAMAQHLASRKQVLDGPGGAAGGPTPDGDGGPKGGKDDVIDAEYEVKK